MLYVCRIVLPLVHPHVKSTRQNIKRDDECPQSNHLTRKAHERRRIPEVAVFKLRIFSVAVFKLHIENILNMEIYDRPLLNSKTLFYCALKPLHVYMFFIHSDRLRLCSNREKESR